MGWSYYHIAEEYFIALVSLVIALRAFRSYRSDLPGQEIRGRFFLIASSFLLLSVSSAAHASIHAFDMNLNLLYQTLFGYCLGLVVLITAISSEQPWTKRYLPFLFVPMLILFHPSIYSIFPIFGDFRPIVWLIISYLSGVVCMLYIAAYYRTRAHNYLYSSLGHALICTSAVLLFFPAHIGSNPWIYGHLLRPLGFTALFFSMQQEDLSKLKNSILYRALTAFSLVASIPLLLYGVLILYEKISPMNIMGRSITVFILLLVTLASALLFGFGLIINLLRPILQFKDSVSRLVERELNEKIEVVSNDEIGELSHAYNEMVIKLRQSVSEKDRLSRLAATGELSATLAHEIRNPLNAINVAASYLKENYRGKLIREFITIIQNEAARINKLTTSLLNFAKPARPDIEKSDIGRLVQEIASLLREDARERGVRIEIRTSDTIPPFDFDYNQIKQVLLNLLINAFDALDSGGQITIQTEVSGGNMLLSVHDNGEGIPEEDRKNIFNPFYTTRVRGTGLGLAVSKKIAKEHGGDIIIESAPMQGSTFTIMLPLKQ